jgi:polysaccharide export outer membrane protein
MIKQYFIYFILILILLNSSSCITTKSATYINNAADSTYLQLNRDSVSLIQKNDILSIAISSLNPEASAIFNTTNNFVINSSTASGSNAQSTGYLVNAEGYIQLPILGNIKADGLSKKQLKDNITSIILEKKLLIDPIVNIRHLNFEVTIIGEVGRPTVITVPSEKISMLKALGLAGDITIYGRKDNVLLVRESEGKNIVKHIDLNSKDFLTSPYYYLQPNDIVYVEPNKDKVASVQRGWQLLPAVFSGLSVLVIILDRIIK